MTDFAVKTLGPVLGDEDAGIDFIEALSAWDAGEANDENLMYIYNKYLFSGNINNRSIAMTSVDALARYNYWEWLWKMMKGNQDKHTVGIL